jgi:hypothetical protein
LAAANEDRAMMTSKERRRERYEILRLMRRRGALPSRLVQYPDPPPDLSDRELDAWAMFRTVLRPIGAVDAGSFAVIEAIVCAFSRAERLHEVRRALANGHPARVELAQAAEAADECMRRGLRALGLTPSMLVYVSSRCLDLPPARVGLAAGPRRPRHA